MVRFRCGTKWITWLLVVLTVCGLARAGGLASAEPGAQADQELLLLGTIDAMLDATTPSVSATFEVQESFPFSVVALANSGDLTTTLSITGPDGAQIASASPSASDPTITFVEAIAAPQAGTYTVTVTRVGESAGAMTLGLLTGYAALDVWDDFESADDDLTLTWSPFTASASSGQVVDGALQLNVHEPDTISYHVPDEDVTWSDLYVEAEITIVGQPSYYEYGFVLRVDWQNETFYSLTVSSDSDWNLYYYDQNGQWNEIQPWTVSPVIDGSDLTPRLSVMIEGNTFRLYFNDVFVGEVTDTNNFASEGAVGLSAATIRDQPDDVTVRFDNLVITSPSEAAPGGEPGSGLGGLDPSTLFGGATTVPDDGPAPTPTTGLPFGLGRPTATPGGGLAIPTATPGGGLSDGLFIPTATPQSAPTQGGLSDGLFIPTATPAASSGLGGLNPAAWSNADPAGIVSDLQRGGIVPPGGSLALTVPSSFGDASASGYYPLGRGQVFGDLVLGFDASLLITGPESGCGMRFHDTGSGRDLALVTEDGAAALAQFAGAEPHPASFLDFASAVIPGQGAVNSVVVTSIGGEANLFVNGELVAQGAFEPTSGTVALELFVAEDAAGNRVRTYCELSNIWLWAY